MADSLVLVDQARAFRLLLAAVEAGSWTAAESAMAVRELALAEKACAAAKTRIAAAAAEAGVHRGSGFADPADWLARHSGTSTGAARRALETDEVLRSSCPDTAEKLASGELSMDQAAEIASTEKTAPGSEHELLALVAGGAGLGRLKEQARKKRAEAIGAEQLYERQRAARRFRHWTTELGNIAFAGELTPDVGVPLVNRLDAELDRIRLEAKRRARTSGEPLEPNEAYAADAFARMLAGAGKPRAHTSELVIVCDLNALRRGHAHQGEPVHIIGGGPIPVDVVRSLADDAFLKVAFHDGVEIHKVFHLGRHIKAELRTALLLGTPPDFEGAVCSHPGCERRQGLQINHKDPVANGGPTTRSNLDFDCTPHHWEDTEGQRQAGLLGRRAQRDGVIPIAAAATPRTGRDPP